MLDPKDGKVSDPTNKRTSMNYFEAKRITKTLKEYQESAQQYWRTRPSDARDWEQRQEGADAPENEESRVLRTKLATLYPEVDYSSRVLGISVTMESYPPRALGGPVLPVNLLYSAIDQHMGYGVTSQQMILDTLNQCIGAAQRIEKDAFWRLILPWYWFIDLPAFLLRIPFLILKSAGLPASIEEGIWAQSIKVIFLIIVLIFASYLGL